MTRPLAPCICLLHGSGDGAPATQEDLFCDFCRTNCIEFRAVHGTRLEPKHLEGRDLAAAQVQAQSAAGDGGR